MNPVLNLSASAVILVIGTAVTVRTREVAGTDPQMQAVLDQLAALGGKPIGKLSPAEARQ